MMITLFLRFSIKKDTDQRKKVCSSFVNQNTKPCTHLTGLVKELFSYEKLMGKRSGPHILQPRYHTVSSGTYSGHSSNLLIMTKMISGVINYCKGYYHKKQQIHINRLQFKILFRIVILFLPLLSSDFKVRNNIYLLNCWFPYLYVDFVVNVSLAFCSFTTPCIPVINTIARQVLFLLSHTDSQI